MEGEREGEYSGWMEGRRGCVEVLRRAANGQACVRLRRGKEKEMAVCCENRKAEEAGQSSRRRVQLSREIVWIDRSGVSWSLVTDRPCAETTKRRALIKTKETMRMKEKKERNDEDEDEGEERIKGRVFVFSGVYKRVGVQRLSLLHGR